MEEGSPLLTSLSQLGVTPEEIDTVVFSHLHFDHVGGASYLDQQRQTSLTFPHARHVVGQIEWIDANSGAPELQTAYSAEDIRPLEDATQLDLVDDDTEIVPGLRTRLTGGHTRGHLSLLFESESEQALYIGDICPSTVHLRRMWGMSYDIDPIETRRRKPQLLGEAADRRWWILWYHDPKVAACRLQRDRKREFIPIDIRNAL
jgi:glyoxylase-like metal-dependent hydrolase (beta-lactamase superfamily II)